MSNNNNKIITIIGKRGYGKSTLAKQLMLQSYNHIFIYDYLREYTGAVYSDYKSLTSDINQSKKIHIYRGSDYNFFVNSCWAVSKKVNGCMCILDEVDLFGKNNSAVEYLYRYGRHRKIDIVAISRRFYDLPVITRALTDEFFILRITEQRDLEYLEKICHGISETVTSLAMFQYIKITI